MIRQFTIATITVVIATIAALPPVQAAPEALLTPSLKDWCGKGAKTMVLTVTDNGRILTRQDQWCWAADATVSAQASADRRGKVYVFLRAHEPTLDATGDTTTGNVANTLRVYQLVRNEFRDPPTPYVAQWIADIVLSPPQDPQSQWPTTYRVRDSAGGGLEVIVDYPAVPGAGCCTPPEKQVSIQIGP